MRAMSLATKRIPVPLSVFRKSHKPALVQEAKCQKDATPCWTHGDFLQGTSEARSLRAASGKAFASVTTIGTLVLILTTDP